MQRVLVGDIGGSNTRFALAECDAGRWRIGNGERLPTPELNDFPRAVDRYCERKGRPKLAGIALCAAGPVRNAGRPDAWVHLTNAALEIDAAAVAHALGVPHVILINDFAANAAALQHLSEDELRRHGEQQPDLAAARLVLGPGTGLGVAGWLPDRGGVIVAGEGGHAQFAPADAREARLFARMADSGGYVSAEQVICGPSLERLYRAICTEDGRAAAVLDAAGIAAHARDHSDPCATEAVERFTSALGRFAGDLALVFGARGGVYLAGGILVRWGALFDIARFRAAFEAKGAFTGYLREIPSATIIHPDPGLLGLAALGAAGAAGDSWQPPPPVSAAGDQASR